MQETKLFCFLNHERICGPDCMAYLVAPPDGDAYRGEGWAHCQLLVNADRLGRHAAVIATCLGRATKAAMDHLADSARTKEPTKAV